jgi:ABC-type transport system substrate-binding protein
MRKEISYAGIALLLILVTSMLAVFPAKAFVQPDKTVDSKYELFGTHCSQLEFLMYSDPDAEFTAMKSGLIDLTDWPLTTTWMDNAHLGNDPNVNIITSGGQNSYYVIDFNEDNSSTIPNPVSGSPRPNPVWNKVGGDAVYPNGIPPITTNVFFRIACDQLFNRSAYSAFLLGSGQMIYTPIPAYMAFWIWGGAGLAPYVYNTTQAALTLYQGHIYNYTDHLGGTASAWYWDYQGIGPHVPTATELVACSLEMTYRMDAFRTKAGTMLHDALVAMGFSFYYYAQVSSGTNYARVMLQKNYLLTTLGWGSVGPDPDYLYDGYSSISFWDDPTSACPNQADVNDSVIDSTAAGIKFATTQAAALAACTAFQQRFEAICCEIPLYSPFGFMANSKYYTGGNNMVAKVPDDGENGFRGEEWLGIGDQNAYGTETWFSQMNMYPDDPIYPPAGNNNMTIRFGWSTDTMPQHVNPLYSEWVWDYLVLGEMYDTLGYRNIYNLAQWMPDLIENWTVGTWYDGNVGQTKSMVTFTLRPDLYWNDGVPMTLRDVIFSLVEVGALAVSKGYPPPWWWTTGELVQSLSQIDAYTCQILLRVQSVWAVGWVLGGFYILPEHVWKPIILTGNPVQTIADPNMVASGPWRYRSWASGSYVAMVANTPGSVVTCTGNAMPAGAVPTTSPEGYHNYCPLQVTVSTSNNPWSANDYQVIWNVTSMTVKSATGTVTCTILNKWWNNSATGFLTVDDYEYVDGVLQGGYPESDTIWSNTTDTDVVTGAPITFNVGLHTIQNTAIVTGPATINASVTNPWLGQNITATIRIYVTTQFDIGGSTFYDDIGWGNQTYSPPITPALKTEFPTPDFKVDGRDITLAARAYASYPGDSRWSSVADVNHDYHVDGRDITLIARQYGWNT